MLVLYRCSKSVVDRFVWIMCFVIVWTICNKFIVLVFDNIMLTCRGAMTIWRSFELCVF
jgi:hypothetical protein